MEVIDRNVGLLNGVQNSYTTALLFMFDFSHHSVINVTLQQQQQPERLTVFVQRLKTIPVVIFAVTQPVNVTLQVADISLYLVTQHAAATASAVDDDAECWLASLTVH